MSDTDLKIYEVEAPNGQILKIEGPVGASEADILQNAESIYQQIQVNNAKPDYKNMSWLEVGERALGNVGKDTKELAGQTVEAVTSPVQTTTGLIDLASAGMSKVLDVTGLSKYADQDKMEKYRKLRSLMAKELSHLATEEGLKERLATKPITSLLDVSMVGQAATLPVKGTRVGGMVNRLSKAVDPTQIVTKPAGALYNKAEQLAKTKTSQMSAATEKVAEHVDAGFVIPPSEVKGSGIVKKASEEFLGEKTATRAANRNQQTINNKTRKFLNIGEDVPLENAMGIIEKRTQPVYDAVADIKPITLSKSKRVQTSTTGPLGETIDTGKRTIRAKKTRSGQQILSDIEKQRTIKNDLYTKAKNKAAKNDGNADFTKAKESYQKLLKLEDELEQLAVLSGNKKLAQQLKDARADRARGHTVEFNINKGNLDAKKFAKQNRKHSKLDQEARDIINFTDEYPNLVTPKKESIITMPKNIPDIGKIGGELYLAGQFGGPLGIAALFGAKQIVPSLLLGKKSQAALKAPNFMIPGTGALKGLSNQPAVSASAYIPSLLESSDAEYGRYL